jgi:hypothetical protein
MRRSLPRRIIILTFGMTILAIHKFRIPQISVLLYIKREKLSFNQT